VNQRLAVPILAAVLLAGCNKGVQSEAAVRQGVIDYLSQRSDLNLSQLDVNVSSVSFRENEADAMVTIRVKGGGGQSMQIPYKLQRKGTRWVVTGKGKDQHSMRPPGQMPQGHPPVGGAQPGGGQAMPPNHPPVDKQGK
jgi:hypothetical protein